MKRLKNVFKLIVLSMATLCLFGALGCARVEPCTMEELVGTFKLTYYSRSYYKTNEQEERVVDREENLLTDKNIQMYLVITGEDVGYLAYKDNDTPLLVREVSFKYNYDFEVVDDEAVYNDKIRTIEYKSIISTAYDKLQDGWEYLGTTNKGKKLNNTHREYERKTLLYKDCVDFERVSKDVDLKKVQEKLGTLPSIETLS